MKSISKINVLGFIGAFCVFGPGAVAVAGSHTWDVWEVFSNADKTVQFVELKETNGTPGETGLAGHIMTANPTGHTYTIQNNVVPPTTNKSYLMATAAFAALPGAPTPDEIMPPNFLTPAADTSCVYPPWDTATWAVGALPTDGINSLTRTAVGSALTPATNSPKNYAGVTGTVDASGGGPLPGVPDGVIGSPVRVDKLAADGSSLSITWDTAACSGELDHQILFGQKNGFPGSPGGTYTLQGGRCDIGTASPFTWTPTPDASDGSGLVWFLIVAENNALREGSWGKYDAANERNGPGTNGASNVCGVTNRDVTNVCGH